MEPRYNLIRFLQDRRGSSFVELALLFPVILIMCFGTMDFARVVYAGTEVAGATRAGVQYGALTPGNSGDTAGMVQAAKDDAQDLGNTITASASNFCTCNGSPVNCATTCSGEPPAGYVSVTANYAFNTLVKYPWLPRSVVLSRTARMRVQ